jgi:hypothetical protein
MGVLSPYWINKNMISPHAKVVAPDEDENPKFDMPWHVATNRAK